MKTKKETRGGTRQGSGAKPKYSEQTKTVAFRCPLSKVDELKLVDFVDVILNYTLCHIICHKKV